MQYLPAARGTAFGFEIHSKLPIGHLRNGEGDPLEIVAEDIPERPGAQDKLLIEWKPPASSFTARLYHDGHRFLFFVAGTGWFRIEPTVSRITVPTTNDLSKIEDKLWGIPALLCFTARGDHALHAAAVESNGGAVLIAGSNRLGRSAISAHFATSGSRVLSQDLACLRITQHIGLVPGPSRLTLPKSFAGDLDMSSGNGTWSQHKDTLTLDATRRGTCKPVPVRSIVLLRAGDSTRLDPLIPAQAVSDLWSTSFRLPTEDDRSRCFQGVADIATNVPVWVLQRDTADTDLHGLVERISSAALEYA